jgi:hypothetical protein
MKRVVLFAALAAVIANGIGVAAGTEPRTYESGGFPITWLQSCVLGHAIVLDAPAVPALTLGGMPASPHQIEVLTPRKKNLVSKPQSQQQRAEATR